MKVELRPLRLEDAEMSYKWRNDSEVWVYTTFVAKQPVSLEDERKWIRSKQRETNSARFAIIAGDAYVGNVYLTDITDNSAEYHIFIGDKSKWGKGIARKASIELLAIARNRLKLKTVELGVHRENVPARALYESLGFIKTGEQGEFLRMTLNLNAEANERHEVRAKPLVSIVCLTYNHRDFITQALDGFLAQQDVSIEILVHDDASTDGTTEVVRTYAKRHPDKIFPYYEATNRYQMRNFSFINEMMDRTKGSYLTVCEGDDYWTDPMKIAKQVRQMEGDTTLALTFHPVYVQMNNEQPSTETVPDQPYQKDYSLNDLVERNFMQTNAVLYRRLSSYVSLPNDIIPSDWYLHLLHAKKGRIGFIPEPMAVYRRHPGGVWWESDKDIDALWRKFGVAHLGLFDATLKLFEHDRAYEPTIHLNIVRMINTLIRVDDESHTLLKDAMSKYPSSVTIGLLDQRHEVDAISQQAKLIEEQATALARHADKQAAIILHLKSELEATHSEIKTLQSLRAVKLHQRLQNARRRLRG